jgi:hypothetical protein
MRGLDADPTSAKLRESGECCSLHFIADYSAHKQPFGHFRKNEQPSEQSPMKMTSRIGEVIFAISLLESWCREGGRTPRGCPRRILSLILGTLQGVASRRNKSQKTFYLHIDTGKFEVAMRRSQKQKSWKRTAIKTATD